MRKVLNSIFLLFLLSGLHPAVFLASRNWHIYTGSQLKTLVFLPPAAVVLLGLVYYGLCYLFFKGVSKLLAVKNITFPERPIRRVFAALFAFSVVFFLLKTTVFAPADKTSLWVGLFLGVAAVFAFLAVTKAGLLMMNIMLLAMVTLASFSWAGAYLRYKKSPEYTSWSMVNRDVNDHISFKTKPNVYLIHLESYHSRQAMKEIYGFDNRKFLDALAERGFTVYKNSFANYNYTLTSVSSMLSMQHHFFRMDTGNMDALGIRDMIGGKTYCAVLQVFLDHGYKCQIIHRSDYMFIESDNLEFVFPKRTAATVFRVFQIDMLNDFWAEILKRYGSHGRTDKKDRIREQNLETALERGVLAAAGSAEPYFSFLEPRGLKHSPNAKDWTELEYFEGQYRKLVERRNPTILKFLDLIIDKDPAAAIITYGDHGAWRYRGILKGYEEPNEALNDRGVKGSTLALDEFGVLLAVRLPGHDLTRFEGTSLVNVFRILFSILSEDEVILDTMVPNDSYRKTDREGRREVYVGVRAGKPLDIWQKLEGK